MSVLKSLFNRGVNQCSKLYDSYDVDFDYDKHGNLVRVVKKFDGQKILDSNGEVVNYDLTILLRAGIDPSSMSVNTSSNSRLSGQIQVDNAVSDGLSTIPENVELKSE